ncbi:FliH/SctL family protein [Candidatus Jidaibacter acanthamoebae]|nr:FliH/SctL family protein [Candidatus Jidaibacter acanthamoeba]
MQPAKTAIRWCINMTTARFPFTEFGASSYILTNDDNALLFNDNSEVEKKTNDDLKDIFYSQKDLEDAKKQAFKEGELQGIEKQKGLEEQFKHTILTTLNSIMEKINELSLNINSDQDGLIQGCAELAFAIADKIKGSAEQSADENSIINFIKDNFNHFADEPVLNIKLNPETYLHIKDEIEKAYSEHNFKGSLMFAIDHSLGREDCAVEFQDACIKKSKQEIIAALDNIYAKYFKAEKYENDVENNLKQTENKE